MTPEQKQHNEEYLIAKKKYENACWEKRRTENEISDIINRRQQIINKINEYQSEKKRYVESHNEIIKTSSDNDNFNSSFKDAESKLDIASQGFIAIGTSSLGNPQNLTEIFSEKNKASKTAISSAFEGLKKIGTSMDEKISNLSNQINNLENELENGRNRERELNYYIDEQKRIMNNTSVEMAYHKKYLS